jgi:phosphoglycerate kinase
MNFRTLDTAEVAGKRVLLRADLNVPVRDGRITDLTRLERLTPTIRELADKGARVIVVSHFDRPKGKVVPAMSLRPISAALRDVLGHDVFFADDCVGPVAEEAGDGEHALSRRRGGKRPRNGQAARRAGRHLRQ